MSLPKAWRPFRPGPLLALLALLALRPAAWGQQPPGALPFVSYGAEQGFGPWSVRALAQDSRGILWVGTDDGIYLYDGRRFQRAPMEGLSSGHIITLRTGRDGEMWCETLDGWARWRGGRWHLHASDWKELRTDARGRAWATRADGLLRERDDGRLEPVPGWPGGEAYALWVESESEVYVGTSEAVHRLGPDGRWRTWKHVMGRAAPPVYIARDGAGSLWRWSLYHVWRLRPGAEEFEPVLGLEPNRALWHAMRDRRGTLGLASDKGLVELGADGTPRGVPGLPTERVRVALEDREGSLWVGGTGLFRLAGRGAWRTHGGREGLPSEEVWAIRRDARGQLWVGTSKGLARATPEGWKVERAVPPVAIRAIQVEPDGSLWLGGSWGELFHYLPGTGELRRFGPEVGLDGHVVLDLARDRRGTLWAATQKGLLRDTGDAGKPRMAPVPLPGAGPAVETVLDLQVDARGRLWVGAMNGLVLLEDGAARRFTQVDGFRRDSAAYVLERRDGQLCVSYYQSAGLTCFRLDGPVPEGMTHLDTSTGLASGRVYQLGEDAEGRLWVGTGRGADVVTPKGQLHFGVADGMPGENCNGRAFLAEADRTVWVGTNTGLGHFQARLYTGPPPPPAALLTSVRAGGEQLPAGSGPYEVPYSRNTLEYMATALTFLNEAAVERESRLLGLESEWRRGRDEVSRYAALEPGAYELQVRARHPRGEWGPTASLSFVVLRPWWRTGWFSGGSLAVLAGLLALALRIRERTLGRKREELEALVVLRTRELREAQSRVVRLERQTTEQQMAGGFAHEMRNTLTGAKMLLGTVRGEGGEGETLCVRNSRLLKDVYLQARDSLPPEARPRVASLLKELNGNEARLDGVLGGVDEALSRGLAFTQMLLEYARLGRERPGDEPVRVSEVLDSILAECQEDFASQGLSVQREVEPGCEVACKPLHLRSILQNLVLNARDALLEKPGAEGRRLRLQASWEAGRVVLRVEDSGVGIPSELRERIFEPFFSTKPDSGVGLGLSMVRKLVDLYGGTLAVESTPGQGTCFTVGLPAAGARHTQPRSA